MRASLSTLLNKGKGYDDIINYIIDRDLEYSRYMPTPLKKLAKEIGITYEVLRKQISRIYEDILDEDTQFYIDIKEVEYQFTMRGRKKTVYFIVKGLPELPRIGEKMNIPYFEEYAGSVLTPINGAQNKKVNNNFPVINQLPYSRRYCMVRSCKGQVNARLIARSNPTGTLDRNLSIQ
jgi:hypothetical protein